MKTEEWRWGKGEGGRGKGGDVEGLVYLEYHNVCSFERIGSPHPLPGKRECLVYVSPPLGPKGGGTHSLADEEVWGTNSDDWKESLALCIICGGGGREREKCRG
jgi:hypothetical protein